jgi:hypothetical protein
MAGELILFPLRFGMRIAGGVLRTGLSVPGKALGLAGGVLGGGVGGADHERTADSNGGAHEPARETTSQPEEAATPMASTAAAAIKPEPPLSIDVEHPVLNDEPVHVSEEPVLVEELAEPGAEDGAGASVEIAEPWEGYGRMNAKEIIARLEGCSPAELAVIELYESANRNRETVLAAVERELKTKNGSGRTS